MDVEEFTLLFPGAHRDVLMETLGDDRIIKETAHGGVEPCAGGGLIPHQKLIGDEHPMIQVDILLVYIADDMVEDGRVPDAFHLDKDVTLERMDLRAPFGIQDSLVRTIRGIDDNVYRVATHTYLKSIGLMDLK